MAPEKGYVHAKAFDEGFLHVSQIHTIYYAQHGKSNGKPVIFLHGGPGGSTSVSNAAFFDPSIYRVVLLDQRGSGKSRPVAEIKENTTQLLVQDIETLRETLGIKKWHMVFGGSWGSTLGLAYAEAHPEATGSLVVRGVLFGERAEFTTIGSLAGRLFPKEYEEFLAYLPEEQRKDPMSAFHKIVFGEDREKANEAARVWNTWEMTISRLVLPENAYEKLNEENWCIQHASMELHYSANGFFFEDQQLYKNLFKIEDIPLSIVQGRYDLVCPPASAWRLHKALPKSNLFWSVDAGHAASEPNTFKKLLEVCDEYGKRDFHL